jgi:starch synthase
MVSMGATRLRVLHVAAEVFPFAKVGGLADVTAGLPRALRAQGVDARLLVPAYPSLRERAAGLRVMQACDNLAGLGRAEILEAAIDEGQPPVWLADSPTFYERPGGPYTDESGTPWPDNLERFAFLCHCALVVSQGVGDWQPDLLHLHDWHTALTPALDTGQGSRRVPCLLTIHNAAYQGTASRAHLRSLGVPDHRLPRGDGAVSSFLGLGVRWAHRVTTVSPTYARELRTPRYGCGLDAVIRDRGDEVIGILNGIDVNVWNPATDPLIVRHYTPDDLTGKRACREALCAETGLDANLQGPLLGIVSRLTWQKGLDLVVRAAPDLLREAAGLVVLGQGEADLEQAFVNLARRHPRRVTVRLAYDEALAHRVIAGADALLIPSRFEPCGLTQMYALRYGTLPVATPVGGLADTVFERHPREPQRDRSNGFVVRPMSARGLTHAIRRARSLFDDPFAWRARQHNGMREDHGWARSAQAYRQLYDAMLREGRGIPGSPVP